MTLGEAGPLGHVAIAQHDGLFAEWKRFLLCSPTLFTALDSCRSHSACLLASYQRWGGGSTERAAEASLEGCIELVAGPVTKLSSAPATLVCGHLLLMARVSLGQIAAFCCL